jgi:hypothetical protein
VDFHQVIAQGISPRLVQFREHARVADSLQIQDVSLASGILRFVNYIVTLIGSQQRVGAVRHVFVTEGARGDGV